MAQMVERMPYTSPLFSSLRHIEFLYYALGAGGRGFKSHSSADNADDSSVW